MIWLVIGLPYALGYIVTFRRIVGQVAWHLADGNNLFQRRYDHPTGEQWFGGLATGLACALVWPASLPIAYGIAGSRAGHGVFYIPPRQRERIKDERIKELERIAGIH